MGVKMYDNRGGRKKVILEEVGRAGLRGLVAVFLACVILGIFAINQGRKMFKTDKDLA